METLKKCPNSENAPVHGAEILMGLSEYSNL